MTILILHGWAVDPDNEAKWQVFRESLKRAGYASQFLALPGLTSPLTTPWGLAEYVAWLKNQPVFKQPVVLLGHSFGGQLACRFAAQYPDSVSALILIDSAGIRDDALVARTKRLIFWIAAKIGKSFTRSSMLRTLLYRVAREHDYYTASPVLRATMARVLDDEVKADLPHIKVPTCVIWGENDTVTPLRLAYRFLKGIAKSKLQIVTGARHSPQFTHPTVTVSFIVEFLRTLKSEERSHA